MRGEDGQVDAIVIYFPAVDYNITQADGIRSRNADANATETSYTDSTRRNLRPEAVFYSYTARAGAQLPDHIYGHSYGCANIAIHTHTHAHSMRILLLNTCHHLHL